MSLPADHSLRRSLNAEIHARPTPPLPTPSKISYLVLLDEQGTAEDAQLNMQQLATLVGGEVPDQSGNHHALRFDDMWVIWERHTEFTRYTVIWTKPNAGATTALSKLPKQWIDQLPGSLLLLSHCDLIAGRSLSPLQSGRNVMRILEIYTYWMMALLALPVARALSPFLAEREEQTRLLSRQLSVARTSNEETELLEKLTSLEAELSESAAEHDFRFSAARAYNELVQKRIEDLREVRVVGLQSIEEFSAKRLAPAMQTCRNVAARQDGLNVHTNRLARLLATRIEINVQNQNREVLKSLDNRAALQLRLQQTVEGLSIAAITYYVVGLVKYGAEALKTMGLPLNDSLVVGLSIPLVALAVGMSLRRLRKKIDQAAPK